MATKNFYVDISLNAQELQSASLEKLTTAAIAALSGGDLFDGRIVYDTDKNKVAHYDGAVWRTIANSEDLNKFGALIGSFDASGGATPDGTTAGEIGSGVDGLGNPLTTNDSIQAGDYWIIDTAGVIPGIKGEDSLSVGDLLIATADDANDAATATAQISDFSVTGLTGDLTITINGTAYVETFDTDAATTLANWDTSHSSNINSIEEITVGVTSADLTLTANVAGNPFTAAISGTGIVSTVETVTEANVSLEWIGVEMNLGDGTSSVDKVANWAATTVYVANQEVTAVSPTTGHRTLYRRVSGGTSGATFNATEEGSWLAIATIGLDRQFASDTALSPAAAGTPTETEIEAWADTNNVYDCLAFYTGTDTSGDTPTYVWWIDVSGVATTLRSATSANDLISDWTATTTYVANNEVTAVSPTTGHRTLYRRIAGGASGATFNAAEEAEWLAISTIGLANQFADDTTVSPALAGQPTTAEIEVWADGVDVADIIVWYTGTDTSSDPQTKVFYVDAAGSAILLNGHVNDGVFSVTKSTALVAATPNSFAAAMTAGNMTNVRGVQVINNANGEDITSGLRIDWPAQEVEANVAIASVTITVLGD